MSKKYWYCQIGPIEEDKIPYGGDGPLRSIVKKKFSQMFNQYPEVCSSGWGLTEEMKTRLSIISMLPTTNPEGNIIKHIDEILEKRLK